MEDSQVNKDMYSIRDSLSKMSARLEVVYNCLVGNEISKDGGLIADISVIRGEMIVLVKRIESMEKSERQRNIYVKIIWAVGAALMAIIISHFLK